MRKNLIPSNAEMLISQANKILDQNKNANRIKKLLAVQAALRGVPIQNIAECFNVSARTVQIWYNKVKNGGYSSLDREPGSGRPHKLSKIQENEIYDWLTDFKASDFDPEEEKWSGELLARVILEEFQVSMSTKWCREYIKHLHSSRNRHMLNIDRLTEKNIAITNERDMLLRENRILKEKLKMARIIKEKGSCTT